jgi:hypothetical protein
MRVVNCHNASREPNWELQADALYFETSTTDQRKDTAGKGLIFKLLAHTVTGSGGRRVSYSRMVANRLSGASTRNWHTYAQMVTLT